MKSKGVGTALLASLLFFASTIGLTGSASSTSATDSAIHITSPVNLMGSIANVQLDSAGNPEWIESGFWVLRLRPASGGSDLPSAFLVARITMVGVDGTATHGHIITNFTLTSATMEGNSTQVFEGTATITLRGNPISGVPLTIKVLNGAAVAMWIGPEKIDSHFGTNPVYGTVGAPTRAVAAEIREGMAVSDRPGPGNATGAALETSSVNYYGNATGYLAQPRGETNLPAVVMIHEWWGLNQHIKDAAEKLAREGYVVLAVDLYNGQVTTEAGRAGELAGSVRNNPGEAINNMNAAVEYLSSQQNVNSSRIASLGWCFGGGQSLQLALNTESPLSATVIYYGNLVTNQTTLSDIEWPVLGVFGSEDRSIPVDSVRQFGAALNANNIENEIYIYPGVGHAFANPSGDSYAPKETADAWEKTVAFLEKHV